MLAMTLTTWALFASLVPADDLPPPVARDVEFARDVRPILARACFSCHGPDKQRSGLRLDRKADALNGGDIGAAILPGDSAGSPLILYVAGAEPDMVMPPKGDRLTREEIGVLRAWVDRGAVWPDDGDGEEKAETWWSFRPITRPAFPTLSDEDAPWARNPIDAFVAVKRREKGLAPAQEADRRTLIRRLSFDLIGLPPTPEDIAAFEQDQAPDAYEKLVDRLLASPHHGERWARHWLDLVHYGDTHGYDKDKPRPNAWPYRDYLIRAFNADRPYARFVQEQVAGDVLFPGTRDGVEALGFLAAGPWDFIGHAEVAESKIDGKIARHLDRDDMVANTINTFLSLTVQCAQCHDHKFDPIKQEDYYRLQAVVAAIDRADKPFYEDPVLGRRAEALARLESKLKAEHFQLLARAAEQGGDELAQLERALADAEKATKAPQRPELGYHSALEPSPERVKWCKSTSARRGTSRAS
jgi:mono/diheme cytochrome c family protein